ncbi:MAG TPA: hypothetical protein VFS43_16630 [Polyangiaceae bacterium]|nr:hypothetical protein [Polyangiaceae bacterium]
MRRAALLLAFTLAAPAPARSAPMGRGVEPVGVFALESDRAGDHAAKTLTNALRQQILDAPEYTLGGESPPLIPTAHDLRCPIKTADERPFDEACLRKLGKFLGVARFFWGFVGADGGRLVVRLHLWQEGRPGRSASLPYDAAARERVVARLYHKLVTPDRVGDLALAGAFEGDLVVDGRPQGAYAPGVELTLVAGEHEIEVRQGLKVVARARARVEVGGRAEARLEPVAEPTPTPPPRLPTEPPPVVIRPRASAWPWALGGATLVGFAGAGVFYALRQDELRGLERSCYGRACTPDQQSAVDRADRYGTLSVASLGVGLAAGAGLATYLIMARREPRVVGGFVPIAGGGAVSIGGHF